MNELATVMFEGQNGPEPPPTGAAVLAVGCLTGGAGAWTLTQASEPVRTTLEAVHDPDFHDANEKALGAATIHLIGMPATTPKDGQKVSVVGLMTRASRSTQTDGINVLELAPIAGDCSR
jgi:hypothetical protein